MAEKLNRDRSSRKQDRSISSDNDQRQNSSRIQFSSNQRGHLGRSEPTLRKRDAQYNRPVPNYPPLEDYAE